MVTSNIYWVLQIGVKRLRQAIEPQPFLNKLSCAPLLLPITGDCTLLSPAMPTVTGKLMPVDEEASDLLTRGVYPTKAPRELCIPLGSFMIGLVFCGEVTMLLCDANTGCIAYHKQQQGPEA